VIRFLLSDKSFRRSVKKLAVDQWMPGSPKMQPVKAAATWPVPSIETAGALAEWLGVTVADLEWFADLYGLNRKGSLKLRHYHYRVLTKQSGTMRLIEAPKPRLKEIQRKILAGILDKIPPHPAVHGFLKGHSIRSFVSPHTGKRVVLKMDLEDFFPSITGARVQALFRTLGYPEAGRGSVGRLVHYGRSLPRMQNARPLFASPSPARRADFASTCEYMCLSLRLPAKRTGQIGGSGVFALRGRPRFFGRRAV
jgi:hypothetical protein